MSKPDFDTLVNEMAENGLDDGYVSQLRDAWKASPIRQERDAANERAQRAEAAAARAVFKELGISIKPEALRTPADLDILDTDKVRAWATDQGLIQAPAAPEPDPAAVEGAEAQQRIAQATANAGQPDTRNTLNEDIQNAQSAEEIQAILRRNGVVGFDPKAFDG